MMNFVQINFPLLLINRQHSRQLFNNTRIEIQLINTFLFFIRSCIIKFLTNQFYLCIIFRDIFFPDLSVMFFSLSFACFDPFTQVCILCINLPTHLCIQQLAKSSVYLIFTEIRRHLLTYHQSNRHRVHFRSLIYHIHDLILVDHMGYFCIGIIFRIIEFILQLLNLFRKMAFFLQLFHYKRITQDIFTDIIFFSLQLTCICYFSTFCSQGSEINTKRFQ